MDSIKLNDFSAFFKQHSKIKTVCFNGTKAETVYNKYIRPQIDNKFDHLQYIKLPSTSPAYAAMNIQQKMTIWSNAVQYNKLNSKN
jgi:hypoxanthine-DNA glycosylase